MFRGPCEKKKKTPPSDLAPAASTTTNPSWHCEMREAGARLGLALAALGQAGAEADGSAAVFAVLCVRLPSLPFVALDS